jgi:Putative zinc-finger
MTAEPREELISAYLDGELSDVQRAEVEKWLAESSQLRRLHTELCAVRAGMQSLPRHQLDHDISGAVLRRAEHSVLRGAEAKPVAGTIRPAPAPTSRWNRGAGWRRVVWPALAIAAALVILIYDANRRPADLEVARAPEQDEVAGAPETGPAAGAPEPEASVRARNDVREERAPTVGLKSAPGRESDAVRPQAPTLEFRAAEKRQPQRMLEDLAKPGAALPASESAPGLAGGKGSLDAPVGQLKAAGGLVVECTPQFLRDRKFEKLLDEKKIKWRRVGDVEAREKKAERGADVDKYKSSALGGATDQPLRVTYQFTATREQVGRILAQLARSVPGRAGAGERLERASEYENTLPVQSAAELADGEATGFTITLVAPATASGPAAGAAAPPANESP